MTTFKDVVEGWQVAPVTAIHPLAHVSDEAYWDSGRAQALEAAEWIPDGGTVMDFGCGNGRLTIPLAKLGYNVIGVDASPAMLDRVRTHADKDQLAVTLHLSDGVNLKTDLPVTSWGRIDTIVCRAVLIHHDYEGVTELVNELVDVLKPGGFLVCDWPTGKPYVRQNWTDVTTWEPKHRLKVAKAAGLELVQPGTDANGAPSVWRKL